MQSMILGRRTRRLFTLAAVTASFAVVPAVVPSSPVIAQAAAACSYHQVGGQRKCLRPGEFCATRNQSDYRRAGFVCGRGSDGRNRLRYR